MEKLYLTCGDFILNSNNMDAIVNAQNKYMQYGSGICGAICRASGNELIEYCQNTYKEYMVNGEVRITPGFNLPMNIIHVLAPKYYEETDPINSLMDYYNNLLLSIKENGYKKVLIPSLGTGVHGYKHEDVVKPLINLLMGFCKMNDVEIYLNNMLPIQKDIYLKYYLQVKNLNIKNDLNNKSINEIKTYLEDNYLLENDIVSKYKNSLYSIDNDIITIIASDDISNYKDLIYNGKTLNYSRIKFYNLKNITDSQTKLLLYKYVNIDNALNKDKYSEVQFISYTSLFKNAFENSNLDIDKYIYDSTKVNK